MTKPVLAQQTDYGRAYIHPRTCEVAPSVTTIIKAGMPKHTRVGESESALLNWAARMSAEYAVKNWRELDQRSVRERLVLIKSAHEEVRDKAADIGDQVHDAIDAWNKDVPLAVWPADSYANQFISFMTATKPRFLESEVTLWSRKHGYAGTADWIAEIGGYVTLGDNKTGRRVYGEVGLQLAALVHADFILRPDGTEEPLPQITHLAALHIRPRSWKLIPVYEPGECFKTFLACKQVLDWSRNTAPGVLGPAWGDGWPE